MVSNNHDSNGHSNGNAASTTEQQYQQNLVHAVQFLYQVLKDLPEVAAAKVAAAAKPPSVYDGFARSLLLAGVKHEAAIRLAITDYLAALNDFHSLKAHQQVMPPAAYDDIENRFKRSLKQRQKILKQLQIEIHSVQPSDLFDSDLMEPVQLIPAPDAYHAGRVHHATTPAFSWADEFGQPQYHRSRVSVFDDFDPVVRFEESASTPLPDDD